MKATVTISRMGRKAFRNTVKNVVAKLCESLFDCRKLLINLLLSCFAHYIFADTYSQEEAQSV